MENKIENLQYIALKSVLKLLSFLPKKIRHISAKRIGALAFKLDKRHREIATDNITKAYKGVLNKYEVCELVEKNFIHLAKFAFDLPVNYKISKKNLDEYVEFSGENNFEKALKENKPLILLTAHMGNFESMALAIAAKFDVSINIVARKLDFEPMDKLLNEIRTRTGNTVINKKKSAKFIQKVLKEKKILGILIDQNDNCHTGVYVPFFGRIACTNKGAAMFAMRYRATVIPIFNYRLKDGRYRIIFEKPLTLAQSSGNTEIDIIENTALFNSTIEKAIKLAPDNWFWVHNRWNLKTIPAHIKKKYKKLISLDL